MYTRRNIRFPVVLRLSSKHFLIFAVWSSFLTGAYLWLLPTGIDLSLPIAPVSTIGVAVAFYIGFKNNQAYDRYWEARKIWGGIVNASRSFANLTLTFVSADHSDQTVDNDFVRSQQRDLIYRQLAWMHSLRFQLRRKTPFGFEPTGAARGFMQKTDVKAMREYLCELLPEQELSVACERVNSATQIMRMQGEHLRKLSDEHKLLTEFRLIALTDLVTEMYTLQGKCERIKNTPFPRQYAYFSLVFTYIFVFLLPFGILRELGSSENSLIWLTVPLSAVISWIFYTMESVGDASEDPFENFVTDVPMTALCRTIEIDLRQMLGETEVPKPLTPVNDVLM
ncbi:MAG: bestrophin family ion channel [Planctomycetota bacterium]